MTSDSAGRRRRRTPLRLIAPSRAAGGDVPDFRLMVEESLSILILMDAEGRIEYTNRLFAEVTGYAPSEVAGRRIHELGDVTPEQAAEIWAAVDGARPWRGDGRAWWAQLAGDSSVA